MMAARERCSVPVRRSRPPALRAAAWPVVVSIGLLHGVDIASAADVSVLYVNPTDGFASELPADPSSTAPGDPRGQQRKASMEAAANEWGTRLDSNIPVSMDVQMVAMSCNAGSAVLGGASVRTVARDWVPAAGGVDAPHASTWYPAALANRLANTDLMSNTSDLQAAFNESIDNNDSCLQGANWYYSVGPEEGPSGTISFYRTVLHEIAHGIGFTSLVDPSTGALFFDLIDSYARNLSDADSGLGWEEMSNQQRAASVVDSGNLVWSGAAVTAGSGILTSGLTDGKVRMYAPDPVRSGSSVSHFDTAFSAGGTDELMEPFASPQSEILLTGQLLADIGWSAQCGDGVVEGNESCDDGNGAAGDGCSSVCSVEECHSCDQGAPSDCTPLTGTPCSDEIGCTTEQCDVGVCLSDAQACTLDVFKFYRAKRGRIGEPFVPTDVELIDALDSRSTHVSKVHAVGNPASRDGVEAAIPEAHAVCYKIKDSTTAAPQPKFQATSVQISHAFGSESLQILKPETLCMPSSSSASGAPPALASGLLDAFKCYRAKRAAGSPKLERRTVTLVDDFEQKQTVVIGPSAFCVPVAVNGIEPSEPNEFLQCFKVKDAKTTPKQDKFAGADLYVRDAFGPKSLRASKTFRVCIPAVAGAT